MGGGVCVVVQDPGVVEWFVVYGCGDGVDFVAGGEVDVVCAGVGAVCAGAWGDAGDVVGHLVLDGAGVWAGWWWVGAGEYGIAGGVGVGGCGVGVVDLEWVVVELADVVCVSVAAV